MGLRDWRDRGCINVGDCLDRGAYSACPGGSGGGCIAFSSGGGSYQKKVSQLMHVEVRLRILTVHCEHNFRGTTRKILTDIVAAAGARRHFC